MALPPQKFREIVLQILFSSSFFDLEELEETALMLMNELKVTKKSVLEAKEKVLKIVDKFSLLDEKIGKFSTEYSVDRISRVEKSILRLAIYEMFFDSSIPKVVVIAEAIRLTRKFGTKESSLFVNAILDRVFKETESFAQQLSEV